MNSDKPENVKKALVILWLLLGLDLIQSIVEFIRISGDDLFGKYVAMVLVSSGITALFLVLISQRKNWARWLYVIFGLMGLSSTLIPTIQNITINPLLKIAELIQMVALIVASILLFTARSRDWFSYEKKDQATDIPVKKPKNYLLIWSLGLFLITLPLLGQMYVLAGILSVQAIHSAIFDSRSVSNSEYIGKEVRLAPFTVVTKMENYDGWRDEYNYIFANRPELANQPRLNEFTTFRVIDEKTKSSVLNSAKKICILENPKKQNQKISIHCEDIHHINEVTKVVYKLTKELEAKGKVYAASTADRQDSKLKPVLKINDFIVFEINNKEELKELVAPNKDQSDSYEYLMRFTHLIPLTEAEVFDEVAQSKIFIHYFGGYWHEDLFGYSEFENYVKNNMTVPDMEKWLMENHTSDKDRWAIRSILSIVQQGLSLENKLDDYKATEFVKGLEASKVCVAKYYSVPASAKNDIDKALDKFFEKGERKLAYERIRSKYNNSFDIKLEPCHQFFPPVICGGEEKCVSWTR